MKFVVKVYAKVLCSDVEYKTLSINYSTTAREMIRLLLNKFRIKHKDPNLFYLTMEVWIRKTGIPIRSVMILDDMACPAQIQASYPHQDTKFSLVMKRGGLVKVYNSCLVSASMYKSLLISDHTTVDELIQLLLNCYDSDERPSKFALYEVCPQRKCERKLHGDELPLRLLMEWPTQDLYFFQLRNNNDEPSQRRKELPWVRSSSSTGNLSLSMDYKSEEEDLHDDFPSMISSATIKPLADYERYFYI